jgi:hypothetical protein
MSKWQKTGTVVIVPPPIEIIADTDRKPSGYERIRAKADYKEPRSSKVETQAQRRQRLAKRRGECPTCGQVTGQPCLDLSCRPAKVYAPSFHRGRPMLPPAAPVTPMTRLTPASTPCKCGHTAGDHRLREGKCSKCRCRKVK